MKRFFAKQGVDSKHASSKTVLCAFMSLLLVFMISFSPILSAYADDNSGDSGLPDLPKAETVELYEVGTWSNSEQISNTGDYIELYIQMLFDDSSYLSWSEWTEKASDQFAGTYYAESSDTSVATVTTQDLYNGQVRVYAAGEGTAQITVYYTPYGGTDADKMTSTTFTVTVPSQAPEYVTGLTILNSQGEAIGDDGIEAYEVGTFYDLYVKVDWYNADTGESWSQTTAAGSESIDGVTWKSDNTSLVYVNASTGRAKIMPNGSGTTAKITVSTLKGKNATNVEDSIYVTYSGQGSKGGYVPAQTLTLSVEYEDMPIDYEPQKYTFTIDEVIDKCGGLQNQAYTYFTGNGSWSTHFAQGVNLYSVLNLVDVDIDDVEKYTFSSQINDGYSIPFSYDILYNTRHYFCWEPALAYESTGGSWTSYAQPTTPLLATSAYTCSGEDMFQYVDASGNVDWSSVPLSTAQVFRLEVGCTGADDTRAQSKSVYNVDTITITLQGGPPVSPGTDDNGNNNNNPSNGSSSGNGTGNGSGNGSGDGTGGSGSGDGSDAIGSGGDNGDGTEGGGTNGSGTGAESGSKRWQVYEMMNNIESRDEDIPYENPFQPFAFPVAAGVVTAGGVTMGVGFRKRL